jgi:glutathione synthase/RimK-type ligase-like ATP-grasp enzyme
MPLRELESGMHGLRTEELFVAAGGKLERTWELTKNGLPMPLTGYTAQMQIRSKRSSNVVLADFSTDTGKYMTISEAAGIVMLDVPDTITSGFDFSSGVYDMYIESPTGDRFRVVEGNVVVSATVTR